MNKSFKFNDVPSISKTFDTATEPSTTTNWPPEIANMYTQHYQCTFALVCGYGDSDTLAEMKPLIISAILLTSCHLHFVILTDSYSFQRINDTIHEELGTTLKPISVEIWKISTNFIKIWAQKFKFEADALLQKKRIWLTTKLYIPFLLRKYEKLIVIDTDMIFLQDPALLWDQFEDKHATWSYKMPVNDMRSEDMICSCLLYTSPSPRDQRGSRMPSSA